MFSAMGQPILIAAFWMAVGLGLQHPPYPWR